MRSLFFHFRQCLFAMKTQVVSTAFTLAVSHHCKLQSTIREFILLDRCHILFRSQFFKTSGKPQYVVITCKIHKYIASSPVQSFNNIIHLVVKCRLFTIQYQKVSISRTKNTMHLIYRVIFSYQTGLIWWEQAPGANLLQKSVSGASSLVCTEICLPWHDMSPVG